MNKIEFNDETVKQIRATLEEATTGMARSFVAMGQECMGAAAGLVNKAVELKGTDQLMKTEEFAEFHETVVNMVKCATLLIHANRTAGFALLDLRAAQWQAKQLDKSDTLPVPSDIAEAANDIVNKLLNTKG